MYLSQYAEVFIQMLSTVSYANTAEVTHLEARRRGWCYWYWARLA